MEPVRAGPNAQPLPPKNPCQPTLQYPRPTSPPHVLAAADKVALVAVSVVAEEHQGLDSAAAAGDG